VGVSPSGRRVRVRQSTASRARRHRRLERRLPRVRQKRQKLARSSRSEARRRVRVLLASHPIVRRTRARRRVFQCITKKKTLARALICSTSCLCLVCVDSRVRTPRRDSLAESRSNVSTRALVVRTLALVRRARSTRSRVRAFARLRSWGFFRRSTRSRRTARRDGERIRPHGRIR